MKSWFIGCLWGCLWGCLLTMVFILAEIGPVKAADLVEDLEKSYLSIDDFQADFEQIETNPLLRRVKKTIGVIYSLPGGKIFWHTRQPSPLKVISNGREVWMYDPNAGQVVHEQWERLDDQTKLALLFLRREQRIKDHFKVSEKKGQWKVVLVPKKGIAIEKITLQLFTHPSEKWLFFNKITFYFQLERKTELILSGIKFNQKLMEKHARIPIDSSIDRQFNFINGLKTLEKKSK